jgi:hypothetical protein
MLQPEELITKLSARTIVLMDIEIKPMEMPTILKAIIIQPKEIKMTYREIRMTLKGTETWCLEVETMLVEVIIWFWEKATQ